jgi:pimeloyl-ACP methyl ester carboxylesterase
LIPPFGTVTTNDGVELKYERFGSAGPVVVLIHGWSGSRHYWDLNSRPIARSCRVVTYDQRHHGESGKPSWGLHVARLAADLRDLLRALGIGAATLVGSSMGAAVIWSYWELFGGENVERCVFVDQAPLQNVAQDWHAGSSGCFDAASLTRLQCRLLADFAGFARDNARFCASPAVPDEVLAALEAETLRASPAALCALMADHTALDWRPLLPRISVPCLNVVGRKSAVFPAWWGCDAVAQLIPDARTVFFEGGNHWLYIEEPRKFSQLVAAFVGEGWAGVERVCPREAAPPAAA